MSIRRGQSSTPDRSQAAFGRGIAKSSSTCGCEGVANKQSWPTDSEPHAAAGLNRTSPLSSTTTHARPTPTPTQPTRMVAPGVGFRTVTMCRARRSVAGRRRKPVLLISSTSWYRSRTKFIAALGRFRVWQLSANNSMLTVSVALGRYGRACQSLEVAMQYRTTYPRNDCAARLPVGCKVCLGVRETWG